MTNVDDIRDMKNNSFNQFMYCFITLQFINTCIC